MRYRRLPRTLHRMRTSPPAARFTSRIALVASLLVAAYFVAFDAADYLRSVSAIVYGHYWPMRHVLLLHIVTGGLALILGALQLCLAFLRKTTNLHRWIGRIYILAVLVSCVSSLVVLSKGSVFGPAWAALLTILSSCALLFTAAGLRAARLRRWRKHAAWMTRSYMAMMVFAWFRLAWELPLLTQTAVADRASMLLGITMLITLVGTELALRYAPAQPPFLGDKNQTALREPRQPRRALLFRS